jgi:acyl-CoA thioester hydrolase
VLVFKNGNMRKQEERMPELVITYRGAVYPWQCDHMGHMNVMWYVGKFDEASWQLLAQLGLSRSRCSKQGKGAVALEQRIDYRRELYAGDLITIRSRVLEVNEKTLRMTHEMTNDETGELAAVTVILGLYFDAYLRKSCLLPSDVRERAMLMITGDGDFDGAISADSQVECEQQPGRVG